MIVATPSARVPRRSRFEAAFVSAVEYIHPLQEITFSVIFTSPSGLQHSVDGFLGWRPKLARTLQAR